MDKFIRVIDNFLSDELANKIEQEFSQSSYGFNWHYNGLTVMGSVNDSPQLTHVMYYRSLNKEKKLEEHISPKFYLIEQMMKDCYEKHDFKEKFIYRIKCNLLFPTHSGRKHLPPHTDYQKGKHSVILYYVNDSDGDTFLFNDDMTVRKRVSPKKNRALYFDGSITHAASNPKNSDSRFVININVGDKDLKDNRLES